MMPVMLYDEDRMKETPLILDLAASPGGKTSHLIARSSRVSRDEPRALTHMSAAYGILYHVYLYHTAGGLRWL